MSDLCVFVAGVGLLGPGLNGWEAARTVLRGEAPLASGATVLPAPQALPSAERRRVGASVKLSMAVGLEAIGQSGLSAAQLPNVFSSTGGDCDNCHNLLEVLASDDRQVSPTRFHNSVHNAPAGYWSIATGCMEASTSLSAFDATFAAALMETASQACHDNKPCLLVAYDTAYPEPLYHQRPIPYPVGVALVLSPTPIANTVAQLRIRLSDATPDTLADPQLEALRTEVPSARALPLLRMLATGEQGCVTLEYLPGMSLQVEVGA